MIKLYTSRSNLACKKAKEWLQDHQLEFEEINWYHQGMSLPEFHKILSLTDNGFLDIISTRSNAYPKFIKKMHKYSLTEVHGILLREKTLLRMPIILDEQCIQIGFNPNDIRKFVPRKYREQCRKVMKV